MDLEKLRRSVTDKDKNTDQIPPSRNQIDKVSKQADKLRLIYGGGNVSRDIYGRRSATPAEVAKVINQAKPEGLK